MRAAAARLALTPRAAVALAAIAVAAGCGPKAAPPVANETPRPPALIGATVLVLPVHPGTVPTPGVTNVNFRTDGVDGLDAEIAYWLPESAPRVKWILPPAVDRTLERSPGLNIDIRNLAVHSFRRMQVRRIGDPLFGDLRRLGAVFDTRYALIPVAAEFRATTASTGRIHIAATLIDTERGTVLWFGVVSGDEAPAGDTGITTSAAQALAGLFRTGS